MGLGYSASGGLSGAGGGAGGELEELAVGNLQGAVLKASDVGSLMCTCSSMRSLADDDEEFAHLLLTKHLGPVKPLLMRILNEEEHEIAPNTYSYDARLIWATAYAKRNDELIHGEEKQRNESIDECAVHPRNHPVISKSGGLCMFSEGPRGGLQEEEADPEGWKKNEEKWDAEEAEQIQGYVAKGAEWCLAEARRLGFDDDDLPDVADVTNDEDFLEVLRECKDREDRKATPPEEERKQARELLTDVVERWSSGKLLRAIGRYMNLCLSVHNPCCHMDEKKSAEVLGYKSQEMLRQTWCSDGMACSSVRSSLAPRLRRKAKKRSRWDRRSGRENWHRSALKWAQRGRKGKSGKKCGGGESLRASTCAWSSSRDASTLSFVWKSCSRLCGRA